MKTIVMFLIMTIILFADSHTIEIQKQPTIGSVTNTDSTIIYKHTDTADIKVSTLDSFTIVAIDKAGNISIKTDLFVLIIPEFKLDVWVIPNPLEIIGGNVKEIDANVDKYFEISARGLGSIGTAIVAICENEIDESTAYGRVYICDAVGNIVARNLDMRFLKAIDGRSVGVCVWDGRNLNKRTVGSGNYVAFIELDVEIIRPLPGEQIIHQKSYKKIIGVRVKD